MKMTTKTMTTISVMSAISTVIYMIGSVPIIPGVPHLKLDFSDIPALITGMLISPMAGVMVELIKNLIHLTRTSTFGIGEMANFIVGVAAILPFSYAAKIKKHDISKLGYAVSSLLTMVFTVVIGLVANAILYPIFMKLLGLEIESVAMMIAYLSSTIAMNVIKSIVVLVCGLPIYFALRKSKQIQMILVSE